MQKHLKKPNNMYPSLPYSRYNWSMNHHMGVATKENLHALVWAAEMFGQNADPNYDINNYLIANNILTKNIRSDSGQPDVWRDYQQIARELGLLFEQPDIMPTPLGLAFIEEKIKFDELLTLQVLRYQYPNGHKSNISSSLRRQLAGTQFHNISTLTELQTITGVQIRPAVLIWRVLRELQTSKDNEPLTVLETQMFLLPCIKHTDTLKTVEAIIRSRQISETFSNIRPNREIQEWFRFLLGTPLFVRRKGRNQSMEISNFGLEYADEVDSICSRLEESDTFWVPDLLNQSNNVTWYAEFGSIDLSIATISPETVELVSDDSEFEDEERTHKTNSLQSINLRPFDSKNLFPSDEISTNSENENNSVISYDRNTSRVQHTLHDKMIVLIANTCLQNGGQVFDDPKSVDLLVGFESYEFLIEVKSVTSRNFVKRLRLALGQLLHYDYLRSFESQFPHRKVVAFAARIPTDSWSIPFIKDYLDFDLLTLGNQGLELNSNFDLSERLFRNIYTQTNLFDSFS